MHFSKSVESVESVAFLHERSYNRSMKDEAKHSIPGRMIGILGGMGPEATLDLYRHIINLTPATTDQDHIRVLIYSNPKIPDRTRAIEAQGESPLSWLIESAKLLEKGGAGVIAMPCNTAHYFLPQIQQEVSVTILDMIEETCRKIRETLSEARTVGLIAAYGTVHCGVYHKALSNAGIKLLIPDDEDQARIRVAIGQVKAGVQDRTTRETFQSIGKCLVDAGARAVILGCTEVPLAFEPKEVNYPTVNPTRILAEAAVAWALGKRK
ncbi:MAG: amino acid racemase [Acidobacteriota bacterium]|jgi:aspartate racemase